MPQDHLHDADGIHPASPCPLCGDGSTPVLSPADEGKLALATAVGMGRPDEAAIVRVLNAAIRVRLWSRALDSALQGCFVPVEIREMDDVQWQPIEQRLSPEEMARYRLEFGNISDEPSESAFGELLTSAECQRLTLATYASFGDGPQFYEQAEAVIHWAETIRRSNQDLVCILDGQLVPYTPDDDEECICERPVDELSAPQRAKYRHSLAQMETWKDQ